MLNHMGTRAALFARLAGLEIPLAAGFFLKNDFFRSLLEHHEKSGIFCDLASRTDLPVTEASRAIESLINDLDMPLSLLQPVLEAVQRINPHALPMTGEAPTLQLLASPYGPAFAKLSKPHEPAAPFSATRQNLVTALKNLWLQTWSASVVENIRALKVDPVVSTGGIIFQEVTQAQLRGAIVTFDRKSKSPWEMHLTSAPETAAGLVDWRIQGCEMHLQKDPLTHLCRIKRATEAHLNPGPKSLTRLLPEQIAQLSQYSARAAEHIKRPLSLSWALNHTRLIITDVQLEESRENYFPYHPDQFSLFEEEKKELKNVPEQQRWFLANQHPLTPLGMSLDYITVRTINQSCRTLKLPVPPRIVRYINGFRYWLDLQENAPSLGQRIKKHLAKKNTPQLIREFKQTYLPKFLETIQIIEKQDMSNRALGDEKTLIEKALQVIMRFVTDNNELRVLLGLQEDAKLRDEAGAYHRLTKRLSEFAAKLHGRKAREAFFTTLNWDQILAQILVEEDGEGLVENLRHMQNDYSFLAREGDSIDIGTVENLNLLVVFLRQALDGHFMPPQAVAAANVDTALTVSEFDAHLLRMVPPLRKILLNAGGKLKGLGYLLDDSDVFYLTFEELFSILDSTTMAPDYLKMLRQLILERKRYFSIWHALSPPFSLPRSGERQANENSFLGKTAVSGSVTGRARPWHTSEDLLRFKKGDILIATQASSQWHPIVQMAGGIILDVDSLSPFAEMLLKHYQIPTLIGTENASELIQENVLISIDTQRQIAEIQDPDSFLY